MILMDKNLNMTIENQKDKSNFDALCIVSIKWRDFRLR